MTKMTAAQYITRREAAEYLARHYGTAAVTTETLAHYACFGRGPEFHKIGRRRVGYTIEALDAWMADRISPAKRSTSEIA
jgi:hypothetical protein